MKVVYSDALIIGGGLAGLRAAVAARQKGLSTIVLSLVPVRRSHSAAAQGGMQASLGNSKMSDGDNEDLHFADTVKGSDWGCDQDVARMFVTTAPKAIRELASWGVAWTRIQKGDRTAVINAQKTTITEEDFRHGYIHSRDFGGTKKWRTCYTSDATGHSMLYAVANEAYKHGADIQDRKEAIALIHQDGVCYGAVVRDLENGELIAYVSKGTLIATGGYGRIYKNTTNAVICEGIGLAIALETGIAKLGNMEAVQFHPTPLFPSGILLTEGCRGDGGLLRDVDGYRFMPDYEPEKKELASRDVVSRRMIQRIREGKGVKSPYGDHLWLDITILGREHIERNLRDVQEICEVFAGLDPAEKWAPVKPMQHYSMGGIRTNYKGETYLKGLFAAGEAACWDMHGFNRLGGNSVSEAVVAGMIIGDYFAQHCVDSQANIHTSVLEKFVQKEQAYLESLVNNSGSENVYAIKNAMKEIMEEDVGIFRDGKGLEDAVKRLEELYKRAKNIGISNKKLHNNPELEDAYRTPKMLKLALCVAKGALDRTESRGAHTREDYPKRDDEKWLKRTLTSWEDPSQTMPTVTYEELDIMKMEIAPGFRGYGAKGMIIENPLSAKRQEQIDKITAEIQAKGGDRYELQEALMEFNLQPKYKARNQRLGDK
ncbi:MULTISPECIES: fumarate reductase flavoprotein subunit [Helicobacter]|uniref:Fumarate reductase flavoprotein subunit n=1 Tax=Helicobacter macacae MIT 99-5501 TaxID=1357400 RepID=V8CDW3_9HELI|nr:MULTISPECIES: fumarate reductase flavoprotein subunit [Helicobacter]ETD25210.1 fumarate reductase flavoprotein subunit [Helicobacter macacae MIT 99-5501]RDU51686.1 fumarate reductase flavoprotein subunit [Helicobacter sp. MIT 01-3238]